MLWRFNGESKTQTCSQIRNIKMKVQILKYLGIFNRGEGSKLNFHWTEFACLWIRIFPQLSPLATTYSNVKNSIQSYNLEIVLQTLHSFPLGHKIFPPLLHLLSRHETGSNSPTGISSYMDKIPYNPYYTIKVILGALFLFLFFFFFF